MQRVFILMFITVVYTHLYLLVLNVIFPSEFLFITISDLILNSWDYYNSSTDPFFEDVRPSYLLLMSLLVLLILVGLLGPITCLNFWFCWI